MRKPNPPILITTVIAGPHPSFMFKEILSTPGNPVDFVLRGEPEATLRALTEAEVAKHNTEGDCWVIISGKVYDVTKFLPDHPGGKKAIMLFAGKDATEEFDMLHPPNVLKKYLPPEACLGPLA